MIQFNLASPPTNNINNQKNTNNYSNNYGILIAVIILGLWTITQTLLLCLNITKITIPVILVIVVAIVWQTFLYTGLFITAHDAMHGVVFRQNPQINHVIGKICVLFYALFSYQELLKKHHLHHRYSSTTEDPDFYENQYQNFFSWYFNFVKSYWSWQQHLGLISVYIILKYIFQICDFNLIVFWVIPSIISSIQLFYFGTFLPHRIEPGGYTSVHRTRSIPLPTFWSFITCYHFGYHKEHHEHPNVPWWRLPDIYHSRSS